jgi:hypothetical protein
MSDPVGTLAAIMDDKDAQIERLRAALEKIKETPVTNSFGWKLCRACHAVFGGEHKPDCVFVSEGISGSPSPDTVRVKRETIRRAHDVVTVHAGPASPLSKELRAILGEQT